MVQEVAETLYRLNWEDAVVAGIAAGLEKRHLTQMLLLRRL